jgi:hypothetical protein
MPAPDAVPLVVLVNPVPVSTTVVPMAAFSTRFGACEVIAGPATVIAGVNVVGAPEVFSTMMGKAPAVTPVVAAALKVKVVPPAPFAAV